MKSMFTVTLNGEPISVVVSADGDGAMRLTRRLLELDSGSEDYGLRSKRAMRARRPTHLECDAFFTSQKAWTGAATVAGFLL
jgi:hypothetical protein